VQYRLRQTCYCVDQKAQGNLMVKKYSNFILQLESGAAVALSEAAINSLIKKSNKSNIPYEILEEVYIRGYSIWNESFNQTPEQFAFDRVNSFIAGGFAAQLDEDLMNEGKRGLWDNIHAKRERIKSGSGERMRKPGSKGAPTDAAIKASQTNEDKDPCWDNYKQVGTKKKNGREVPNCVPVKENADLDKVNKIADELKFSTKPKKLPHVDDGAPEMFKIGKKKEVSETNTPSDREVGSTSLINIYADATPGQSEFLKTIKRVVKEATYQGKKVPLNKPMQGDVKKSKVFVDPDGDGKAQKVNFGDKNMTIKKNIPARRKSFRARHNCDNPGPKTKARYWSCRAW
jgi:hypothetical protein